MSSSTLARRLTPWSAALFGLSYICPTVVFSTFGILARTTEGTTATAYVVATLTILLTAVSYGRMAARWPLSGSAYTYVSRTTNVALGFIAGWVLILDYFLVPMVICLFTAKAFEVVFPHVSYRFWVVVIAAMTTTLNILGIQVANRVNLVITAAQFVIIAALLILCVVFLQSASGSGAAWTTLPFVNSSTTLPAIVGGAAIAAYSFLGFDAVTTMSEETVDPVRSIPRATLFAAACAGLIYIICSFFMGLVHPSSSFQDEDNAGYEILQQVSGHGFLLMFSVVLCAFIASIMCAQAGSSRLLFAMARDGTLPRKLLTYLHPRFRTPVFNIGLIGLIMIGGEWLDVEAAAACVNFGAFAAFTAVNLCVVYDHYSARRQLAGGAVKVAQASLGALATTWLLVNLHKTALTVGLVWLLAGIAYLLVRTRGFRISLPSADGPD